MGALGLRLPLRIYRSRNGRAPDYPVMDKFPLFLSGASVAPVPVVTFFYEDGNLGWPAGFDTYRLENTESFSRDRNPIRWCMYRLTKGRS